MSIFFSFLPEAEFLDIAEKLKPHIKNRMKIEPFPWLLDYYVDMDELYTELTLEKIENKVVGPSNQKLKDYKDMFSSDVRYKVLMKGAREWGKPPWGRKKGMIGQMRGSKCFQ